MNAQEFRNKLESLGLTQAGVSRILRVDARGVRRWAIGERPVPGYAIAFLDLLGACPPALAWVKQHKATDASPPPGA